MAKKTHSEEIEIIGFREGRVTFNVIGETPLIYNRMTEKARRDLLLPPKQKTRADKASSLKHDPLQEYRDSPYAHRMREDAPTYLYMPAGAIKKAMASAAVDMPGGASRASVGRLVRIAEAQTHVSIYGVPEIYTTVVRQAGMNKTPDIRSRAIVPQWAFTLSVIFPEPMLNAQSIGRLLAAAGRFIGVGDFRQEKGAGDYGLFRIVESDEDQAAFDEIVATGGRAEQLEAMQNPNCHDEETAELLGWFFEEAQQRFGTAATLPGNRLAAE